MSEDTMAIDRRTGFDIQSIFIGTPAVRFAIQSFTSAVTQRRSARLLSASGRPSQRFVANFRLIQ
jgi:hypothetical protein